MISCKYFRNRAGCFRPQPYAVWVAIIALVAEHRHKWLTPGQRRCSIRRNRAQALASRFSRPRWLNKIGKPGYSHFSRKRARRKFM